MLGLRIGKEVRIPGRFRRMESAAKIRKESQKSSERQARKPKQKHCGLQEILPPFQTGRTLGFIQKSLLRKWNPNGDFGGVLRTSKLGSNCKKNLINLN